LLLELEPIIDAEVNARVISIAGAVRRMRIAGVRDVISTYRSVAVHFDPLQTDQEVVAQALIRASEEPAESPAATMIEVPVNYGGEDGPDLEDVASLSGLSPGEVIARHAGRTYRVFMLGFTPGFAYLGSVDERIAVPRRNNPRVRVRAGSVGLAGRQTGIYPHESPGGWQIIGVTSIEAFDPNRPVPALFAPGDHVRFVPVSPAAVASGFPGLSEVEGSRTGGPEGSALQAPRTVTVLAAGLFTTVQDSGRWGYQNLGVPVAGPMDPVSHRQANLLVGNAPAAATLEATLIGPELRFDADTVVAIAGAEVEATVDGGVLPMCHAARCKAGSILRFGERRRGARAYIGFDGGIELPKVLGSRATHVVSSMGGIDGRPLRAGDRVALGEPQGDVARGTISCPVPPSGGARVRVLPGPQDDFFDSSALEGLLQCRFTISPMSDRMGYRLAGASKIERSHGREMISDAAFVGGIQVPPSGEPIVLMTDRPTTGGYPQIATVITADLPLAGQLGPGDWIEFEICSREEALAALVAQEGRLLAIR
jgi:KipI family sensor histidine kinase inhibitor